ncbi:OmpP1/FadL family transporter [Candidatus Omnitrophota bacterium]
MKPYMLSKRTGSVLFAAIIAALAITVPAVTAQEVAVDNESGVGARAMGMGGASIAAVNDLTAVIYNPAALARLSNMEVHLGVNILKRDVQSTLKSVAEGNGTATSLTDYSGIGSFGVAYPVPTERGSLVFALAYNRIKDFEGRFEVDGYNDTLAGFETDESIEEGGLSIMSVAGAMDVSPNVSFGASLDIWMGSYKRNNRMLLNDYTYDDNPDLSYYSQLDMTGVDDDITAWSFKPSILYHKKRFRFGAYLRFPMRFHVKEYNYQEYYVRDDGQYFGLYEMIDPSSEFSDGADDDHMSYTIKAPIQLGFGLAWNPTGMSMVAFDLIYENWRQGRLDYPSDYFQEPGYFRNKYRSSLSWRIGYEQRLPFGLIGRVGYLRQPLTFKGPRGYESDLPSIVVENERDFITFGFGKQFEEALSVDVGFAYGFWSEKEEPRTDEENRTRIYVSVTYRAPKLFE